MRSRARAMFEAIADEKDASVAQVQSRLVTAQTLAIIETAEALSSIAEILETKTIAVKDTGRE